MGRAGERKSVYTHARQTGVAEANTATTAMDNDPGTEIRQHGIITS